MIDIAKVDRLRRQYARLANELNASDEQYHSIIKRKKEAKTEEEKELAQHDLAVLIYHETELYRKINECRLKMFANGVRHNVWYDLPSGKLLIDSNDCIHLGLTEIVASI